MIREHRNAVTAAFLALWILLPGGGAAQSELGQQGQIWNLGTQETGKVFPTTVSAFNESCP